MNIRMNPETPRTVGQLVSLGAATIPGTEPRRDVRIINHFNSQEAAARYAGNRPQSHRRVLALVESILGAALPVERALDVGCGTGHSTVALLPLAPRCTAVQAWL